MAAKSPEFTEEEKTIIATVQTLGGRARSVIEQKAMNLRQDKKWCEAHGADAVESSSCGMFRRSKTIDYKNPFEVMAVVKVYREMYLPKGVYF